VARPSLTPAIALSFWSGGEGFFTARTNSDGMNTRGKSWKDTAGRQLVMEMQICRSLRESWPNATQLGVHPRFIQQFQQ
jgi:hypothetical protein